MKAKPKGIEGGWSTGEGNPPPRAEAKAAVPKPKAESGLLTPRTLRGTVAEEIAAAAAAPTTERSSTDPGSSPRGASPGEGMSTVMRVRRRLKELGSTGVAKVLLTSIDEEAVEVVGAAAAEARAHVRRGLLPNIGAHGVGRGSDVTKMGVMSHREWIEKTYIKIQEETHGYGIDPRWNQSRAKKKAPENLPRKMNFEDWFSHVPENLELRIVEFSCLAQWKPTTTELDWEVPHNTLMNYKAKRFSKALTRMLRHHGPLKYKLRIDTGGWGSFKEYLDAANWSARTQYTPGQALRIIAADRKNRFQCAMLVKFLDTSPEPEPIETMLIRTCTGHSFDWLELERIYVRVSAEIAARGYESMLAHQTSYWNYPNIMRQGLRPGSTFLEGEAGVGNDGRPLIYFSPFLPEDGRNVVGGRGKQGHDTTFLCNFTELVENKKMTFGWRGTV